MSTGAMIRENSQKTDNNDLSALSDLDPLWWVATSFYQENYLIFCVFGHKFAKLFKLLGETSKGLLGSQLHKREFLSYKVVLLSFVYKFMRFYERQCPMELMLKFSTHLQHKDRLMRTTIWGRKDCQKTSFNKLYKTTHDQCKPNLYIMPAWTFKA